MNSDKPHEECGVFGIFDCADAAAVTYYGLFALQHRGQEAAGIATVDAGKMVSHRGLGLLPDVFAAGQMDKLSGPAAIGHVRYSTAGSNTLQNAQPITVRTWQGNLAMAHNGNLVNAHLLRAQLERDGSLFQSTSDTEVVLHLVARGQHDTLVGNIAASIREIRGGYALVFLGDEELVAVRDPLGLRPLCLGTLNDSTVIASESCALTAVGATFVRDVAPGEMVVVNVDGVRSLYPAQQAPAPGGVTGPGGVAAAGAAPAPGAVAAAGAAPVPGAAPAPGLTAASAMCTFEHIYFARPDSDIDGWNVHAVRKRLGRILAQRHGVAADIVVGVPDSSLSAASGYAEASGIPYEMGLVKNKYIARTFIQPTQGQRDLAVRLKLTAVPSTVVGQRVVLVDDSIVRGTTIRRIVQMLRDSGATEVHVRISSPPYTHSCHYGIDTSSKGQLAASNHSVDEIRRDIGADTLEYLTVDELMQAFDQPAGGPYPFCNACFTGKYPTEVHSVEKLHHEAAAGVRA